MTTNTLSVPGPHVPGWMMALTHLSPIRIEFDSLTYLTENAAKYGPFFAIYAGKEVTYVITDPQLAYEVFVTRHQEFHKADLIRHAVTPFAGNGLLTSEGDFWKRQRKLAQPAFHHQRIAAYGAMVTDETQKLIATWQPGETRNLARDMMALTLKVVNKTLFNVELNEQVDHIGELMQVILEAANDRINSYNPLFERIFKGQKRRETAALAELNRIIDDIITQHRAQGDDQGDLLSMLLAARDEDGEPMEERQLRDEVVTLFIAGHETTANALTWTFYLLAENPTVTQKLMTEIATLQGQIPTVRDLAQLPYSEQVVKESMRLYPPAGGATRQPLHDIELGGYPIPKGSNMAVSSHAMHRDPTLFPDPLRFDPDRFSPENESKIPKYAYLPFGGGPRVCIGNSFAMMEARLALITILQQWKLQLAPNQTIRAEQLFTTRPKGGVLRMMVEK
jgi:cytochrome P450